MDTTMKTDDCMTDDAIIPRHLMHEAPTITDDDLDYIWQMQEVLLARGTQADGANSRSADAGEAAGVDSPLIVLFPV